MMSKILSDLKLTELLEPKSELDTTQNADIFYSIYKNPEFTNFLNNIGVLKRKESKIIINENHKIFTYQGVFKNKIEFDCILNNFEKNNQTIQNFIIRPIKNNEISDEKAEPNFFNCEEVRFISYKIENSGENKYIAVVSKLKDNKIKNSYYNEKGIWLATDYIKYLRLTNRNQHYVIFSDKDESNNSKYNISENSLLAFAPKEIIYMSVLQKQKKLPIVALYANLILENN